jgi:hypothetical protein
MLRCVARRPVKSCSADRAFCGLRLSVSEMVPSRRPPKKPGGLRYKILFQGRVCQYRCSVRFEQQTHASQTGKYR